MDAYTFKGVVKEQVMGFEVDMPLGFTIILADDADENLIHDAAKVVVYAITDHLKDVNEVGNDGGVVFEDFGE